MQLVETEAIFDSHAHFDDPACAPHELAVELGHLPAWDGAVSAGFGPERFAGSRAICSAEPRLQRALGLHPWWLASHTEAAREAGWAELRAELDLGDAVAIGETGVDKGRRELMATDLQIRWFNRHLHEARRRNLPLVLHIVGWHGHAIAALARAGGNWRGVVHRFSGAAELVRDYVALGLSVSLALEPRADPIAREAIARAVPSDRLLLETDWPCRGLRYPAAVAELRALALQIAQWRAQDASSLVALTRRNALALFAPQVHTQ